LSGPNTGELGLLEVADHAPAVGVDEREDRAADAGIAARAHVEIGDEPVHGCRDPRIAELELCALEPHHGGPDRGIVRIGHAEIIPSLCEHGPGIVEARAGAIERCSCPVAILIRHRADLRERLDAPRLRFGEPECRLGVTHSGLGAHHLVGEYGDVLSRLVQLRASLIHRNLEGPRIDSEEQLSRAHGLIVHDRQLHDRARDLGRDADDGCVHVAVVGRGVMRPMPQQGNDQDCH